MSEFLSIIHEESRPLTRAMSELGIHGEALAADYLKKQGYRLVLANFRVPVGRNSRSVQVTGEIDLIALEGETLCFVEVKARRSADFTPIRSNVDLRKQRQIIRTARVYRRTFGLWEMHYRFDVVTVLIPKHSEPTIDLTRGFWSESKFQKRKWDHKGWNGFS